MPSIQERIQVEVGAHNFIAEEIQELQVQIQSKNADLLLSRGRISLLEELLAEEKAVSELPADKPAESE